MDSMVMLAQLRVGMKLACQLGCTPGGQHAHVFELFCWIKHSTQVITNQVSTPTRLTFEAIIVFVLSRLFAGKSFEFSRAIKNNHL